VLTRIEIDGFKTFKDFALDVPPFLAVIGPNAVGKSNLFDALQFLRDVTDRGLAAAVQAARGGLDDLFRRRGDGSQVRTMRLAVEVLLDAEARDSWGTEVDLTQTRIRYELVISWQIDRHGNSRLLVDHEEVRPLRRSHRNLQKAWRASAVFMDTHVRAKRVSPFLETTDDPQRGRVFQIRQDSVQGRPRPASSAEETVLSSMTSAEFKHLYALRQEILSLRRLQLEPQALRLPGERFGDDYLRPDGGNLARVLSRIRSETATDARPNGLLDDISTDLSALIPGVTGFAVDENTQTRKWQVSVFGRDEGPYPATVASDGTLRVLALLTALYDPRYRGVLCFEEPENGVHPAQLRRLVRFLKDLVTDPAAVEPDGPLSQVLLNSHSPLVLEAVNSSDCILLEPLSLIETGASGESVRSRVTDYRRVVDDSGQPSLLDPGSLPAVARDMVERSWARETLRSMLASAAGGGRRRARRVEDLLGVWAQRLDLQELTRLSQGRRLVDDTTAALRTLGIIG
jgi:predicted ATPase